ncbi:MAG: LacI family transcriptional regulator [Candidatus Izimaplasma sp.]|nr:LacI family transcriptional regulator [Candidatus Izimaplasma bacterium]
MPTIKDVAKKAGVGIATVSRVLNDSGYVKQETREKVEKVIREVGYHPNELARSMLRQKNHIVAFVLPNNTHLFFSELLYELEQILFHDDYKVMMCNSSEEVERELEFIDMLKNNRVDSLILLTNNDIEDKISPDLPIVSFDRRLENIPFVASDNYAGGVMAADLLYKQGCKRYMFIGDDAQGPQTNIRTEVSKRRVGFVERLQELGIGDVITYEYPLGNYIISQKVVEEVIRDNPEVDGIFAISDAVAFAIINELERIGKKVPKDVKVIGFDGGRSFLNSGKRITSIGQSPRLIAKALRNAIIDIYNGEVVPNVIVPIYYAEGDTI